MSDSPKPFQKFEIDVTTGDTKMVDLTPEEVAEVEAKQTAVQAQMAVEAAATEAAEAQAEADKAALDARPNADDIAKATTVAALKDLMLKQAAAIDVLVKRQGLNG